METMMTWVGPTLDVAAVVLLTAVLWRLGRDPGAAWGEREARLQALFDDLRSLVAQSEGLARDLDGKLAGREERLRALVAEAQAAASDGRGSAPVTRVAEARAAAPAVDPSASEPAEIATRIEALADAGTPAEEIARRLGVAPAEVRLVIGLKAARAARRRAATSEARAHA